MATSIGLVNPTTTQDINCRCINSKSNCFRSKMCNATDKKVEYLKSVKVISLGLISMYQQFTQILQTHGTRTSSLLVWVDGLEEKEGVPKKRILMIPYFSLTKHLFDTCLR